MATHTIDIREKLADYNVLLGGYGPSVEFADLNKDEVKLMQSFIKDSAKLLARVSPAIADDFSSQANLFITFAQIFKAKVDEKPFGGVTPSSSQFGANLIIPQTIKYSSTTPTDYESNSWLVNLTAGTPSYLLGSSSEFYKASSTVGSRAMLVIMKNGLIEVGTTPKIDQIQVQTEKVNYAPFTVHPLVDQSIEKEKLIYQYNLPFAIPVYHDFGIKLSVMPTKAGGYSDLRLIGVVFYEAGFLNSLKYIS